MNTNRLTESKTYKNAVDHNSEPQKKDLSEAKILHLQPNPPQGLPPSSVVIQHLSNTLLYMAGKQELPLRHCIQKVFISSFYGEFSIYDPSGRLLGKSKDSKLSFMKDDLQTEVAKVLFDAMSIQNEYTTLKTKYNVKDPGMCFGFGNILIEFEDAPPVDNVRAFDHIPVFYNITNVYVHGKKETLFKI